MQLTDLLDPIVAFMDGFGYYMLLVFVIVARINAAILALASIRHRRNGVAVNARVINIRQGTDSDDNVTYAADFEVANGPYAGTVWASRMTSSTPYHQVGDVLQASCNPKTGVIHSGKTIGGHRIIAIGMLGMGLLFLYVFIREY